MLRKSPTIRDSVCIKNNVTGEICRVKRIEATDKIEKGVNTDWGYCSKTEWKDSKTKG